MIKRLLVVSALSLVFTVSSAYAAPSIQLLSPQNTSYSENKVFVNATSDEAVDFYMKYDSVEVVLANQTESLETYLYVKKGSYNFTIYANNSNGTASENLVFTVGSQPEPVEITTCGMLYSPDTQYILVNDVSSSRFCFIIFDENVSFNLNGYNVNSNYWATFYTSCKDSEIYNGTVTSSGFAMFLPESSKCVIRDLGMSGDSFAMAEGAYGLLFENINADVDRDGIVINGMPSSMSVRNSTFSGDSSGSFISEEGAYFSTVKVENTVIDGFYYDLNLDNYHSDYYIRNSNVDTSKIEGGYGFTRVFIQHLVKINVTENGTGVPSTVEIVDSSDLPKTPLEYHEYVLYSSPSSNFTIGTDQNGQAETWLTERFIVYKAFSPGYVSEHVLSPYNLTVRSATPTQSQMLDINGNSTFKIGFNITLPKLPKCTINQMFDLNNDGSVNINDAVVMLRKVTGLPVQAGGPKECEARHFFAQT